MGSFRKWVHEKWIKAWDESNKARWVWQHMRRQDRDSPWWKLPRAKQSIIAQCRTGHCPVGAYFARLRQNYNDRCRHCGESDETIHHVLRECPQLRQLRERLSVEPSLMSEKDRAYALRTLRPRQGFLHLARNDRRLFTPDLSEGLHTQHNT